MKKKGAHKHEHENKSTVKRIVRHQKTVALNGRYLKKEELGKGAFGVVFSAFDQDTSKTVAIKCLIDNSAIEDFQSELSLLKRLKHPSIVPYLDSFVDSKKALYIVMEFAENGSLLDIVKNYGPLNEMITTIYLSQVLEGLQYLHNQSIIHRDIKAANILMKGDGAKLADFGLAIDLDKYGHTLREAAGSPYWMAPEVINGDPIDCKSDIWSIGVTTVELLTGRPPLWDLPPMPAMFQIAGPRDIPLPKQISPQCKDFLTLCLNKNSKLRPDAKQLLEHPWLSKALEVRKHLKASVSQKKGTEKMDMGSLTMRLGGSAFWDDPGIKNAPIPPDEMCFMLNDDKKFEEAALLIMNAIPSTKRLPHLIQDICGARNIIDKMKEKCFKVETLNFLQQVVPYAENIATTLLLHSIPQNLLLNNDVNEDQNIILHQKLTALSIIFSSSKGPKFCCYSGLVNKIDYLCSSPMISIYVPRLILNIFNSNFSGDIISILLANKNSIKRYVTLTFKACLHIEEYKKMLETNFNKISESIDPSVSDRLDKFKGPMISNQLLDIPKTMIEDCLSLLLRISMLSPQSQLYLAEEFSPLCYIIINKAKFTSLTDKNYSTLLHILNNVTSNLVAREKINCESLLSILINNITGSEEDDSACMMQIVSNMIHHIPELIESACDHGLCLALERSRNLVEATVRIRDMICEIPTISSFCVWKLKETQLYEILIEMLELPIWNRKAVKALSYWIQYDSRYISKHLMKAKDDIEAFIITELRAIDANHLHPECFVDIARMMQYCPEIGHSLYSQEILEGCLKCLSLVGPFGQIQMFEFLIQLILQSPNPNQIAASIIQQMIPYSQSSIIQVQKSALRIRVLSRC